MRVEHGHLHLWGGRRDHATGGHECATLGAMLVPCDACGRHLRAHEFCCPFCDARRAPSEAVAEAPMPPRLSRAALLVAGSMVLAGCPMAVRYGGPPPSMQQPPPAADATPAPTQPAPAPAAPANAAPANAAPAATPTP